jgi:hypothetical protein
MIEKTLPLAIWIGNKEKVLEQYNTMLSIAPNKEKFKEVFKFCPNIIKLEATLKPKKEENKSNPTTETNKNNDESNNSKNNYSNTPS